MNFDEEEKEDEEEEESEPVRIAIEVIASLPHSPVKIATPSMETTLASLILITIDAPTVQLVFTPTQLSLSLIKVTSTLSTKLKTPSIIELIKHHQAPWVKLEPTTTPIMTEHHLLSIESINSKVKSYSNI